MLSKKYVSDYPASQRGVFSKHVPSLDAFLLLLLVLPRPPLSLPSSPSPPPLPPMSR